MMCYYMCNKRQGGCYMVIEIDFNSDEAIQITGRGSSSVGKTAGGYHRHQYAYGK